MLAADRQVSVFGARHHDLASAIRSVNPALRKAVRPTIR